MATTRTVRDLPRYVATLIAPADVARAALIDGLPVLLAVRPADGKGEAETYSIRLIEGGWEVCKLHRQTMEPVKTYHVDDSWGPTPPDWDCNCPSCVYDRPHHKARWIGCKHCRLVAAVYARLNGGR